jgi:DNA modification methylase
MKIEQIGDATLYLGDCLESLRAMPEVKVQTCITSPPYWGLRDYGVHGQLGLESTPEEYVARLVAVFREVKRVLREDGTLWVNLGDTYAQAGGPGWQGKNGGRATRQFTLHRDSVPMREITRHPPEGLKPKDLVGIPWRVAFALQADGWYLRSDIIWHKPNPMPESVTDRPTKAHEYIFLLSKSERYYYDAEAVKEPCESSPSDIRKMEQSLPRIGGKHKMLIDPYSKASASTNIGQLRGVGDPSGRNRRSVWTIATTPYKGAHFATYPRALVEPCILAGSREGDIILDPFGGSGTTAAVALSLGRRAVLCELNPEYAGLIHDRVMSEEAYQQPRLFADEKPKPVPQELGL